MPTEKPRSNRLVTLRPGEGRPFALSALHAFLLLAAYYVVRPLRDEISSEDAGSVHLLWTATFVATLIAVWIYSWTASRLRRGVFVPLAYRAFGAALVALAVALLVSPAERSPWLERAFYLWASVFPVFTVSVLWSLLADLWSSEAAKRLYGLISVGASFGALGGAWLTRHLIGRLEPGHLMLVAVLLLELAARCARALDRGGARRSGEPAPFGGGFASGLRTILRSRYLLGIAAFLTLHSSVGSFFNLQLYRYLQEAIADRAERTQLLATLDIWVTSLELGMQALVFHRLVGRAGLGASLLAMPLFSFAGLVAFGLAPTLGMLVVLQVLRRASNFGLTKPAREALFTVVPREPKYKAKAFIDTVVYRGSDSAFAWGTEGIERLGLTLASVSWIAAPFGAAWVLLAIGLGRAAERRAAAGAEPA